MGRRKAERTGKSARDQFRVRLSMLLVYQSHFFKLYLVMDSLTGYEPTRVTLRQAVHVVLVALQSLLYVDKQSVVNSRLTLSESRWA